MEKNYKRKNELTTKNKKKMYYLWSIIITIKKVWSMKSI